MCVVCGVVCFFVEDAAAAEIYTLGVWRVRLFFERFRRVLCVSECVCVFARKLSTFCSSKRSTLVSRESETYFHRSALLLFSRESETYFQEKERVRLIFIKALYSYFKRKKE